MENKGTVPFMKVEAEADLKIDFGDFGRSSALSDHNTLEEFQNRCNTDRYLARSPHQLHPDPLPFVAFNSRKHNLRTMSLYEFIFPDGGSIKLKDLSRPNVENLVVQLDRDILGVKSMTLAAGGQPAELTTFDGNNMRFSKYLIPGRYLVVLQEDIEEFFVFCLCGSYLHWLLSGVDAYQKGREIFPKCSKILLKNTRQCCGAVKSLRCN
jgi:hypothetical protein